MQHLDAERSILASRLVGIVRITDCVIGWCNECFASMFGYSSQELVGKPPRVLHPDDAAHAAVAERALPVMGRGEVFRAEFAGRRKNGSGGWFQATFETVSGAANEHLGVCVEVSEQRRRFVELEEARADLQAILDHVPARISAWNADLTNRFANRAAERHFRVGEGGAFGMPAAEIVGPARHLESWPYVAAALAGERTLRSAVDPQPDGSVRHSEVAYVPMRREGRVIGFYVLGSDVTDLRNSYERIRDLARRLETVREDERRMVARLLHEGIAQDLYAAKLQVERLRCAGLAQGSNVAEHTALADAIERCLDGARLLADEIWPSALAHLSLADAIAAHARSYELLTGIPIAVTVTETLPPIHDPVRFVLFRAVQEALAQAARVRRACRVNITLRCDSRAIVMVMRDETSATDDASLADCGEKELPGVRESVTAVGGSVTSTRKFGGGGTLTVSIPVDGAGPELL